MRLPLLLLTLFLTTPAFAVDTTVAANSICSHVTEPTEYRQCLEKATTLTSDGGKTVTGLSSLIFPVAWWLFYYGIGVVIGLFVLRDARNRTWLVLGIRPIWWLLIVAFDAPLGLLVYWALHYSKLAQTYTESQGAGPAK